MRERIGLVIEAVMDVSCAMVGHVGYCFFMRHWVNSHLARWCFYDARPR